MIEFDFKVDTKKASSTFDRFSKAAEKAEFDAMKRSTKAMERAIIDETRKSVNLPLKKVRDNIKFNQYKGQITIFKEAPNLVNFLSKTVLNKMNDRSMYRDPKRKGLRFKLFKGQSQIQIDGTFLAYGKNDNLLVFKRRGTSPASKLISLSGRWSRDFWEIPDVRESAFKVAVETYDKRFTQTFNFQSNK